MRFVFYGIQLYRLFLENKKKFLYIPLGLYWLLIFILTSIPGRLIPNILIFSDKLKHFIAYSVLAFLLFFALTLQKKYNLLSKNTFLFTLIITAIYGIFDEIHQIFIPGRYFDWWDFFADVVGSIIGILIAKYMVLYNYEKSVKTEEQISS